MKVLSVFLFLTILSVSSFAQSKKDFKKNKVKTYRESHTSVENGKQVTLDIMSQKFDINGNVIEEVDYDKTGKLKEKTIFLYNKNNDKVEEQLLGADGKLKKKKVFKYNAKGDRTEEIQYDSAGKMTHRIENNYDANGNKSSETTFDASNKPIEKITYSYDKKGMLISEKKSNGAGALIKEDKFFIEY